MLVGALLSLALLVAAPQQARAATTGSGGWYWPVGTENFHGWDGYWVFRPANHSWHMAQDMPVPVGHAVYAVGDGTILESGADHGYGGVLVILHKTGGGRYFKAVYGHIARAHGTVKGAKVKAGQVIGHVNSAAHCHFGIHPGKAYPPDNNPYRGHTYIESKTYGWVDPVKYLRANPRFLPYTAPKVPVVATVETTDKPTVIGVSRGSVYWSTGRDALLCVYERALQGGETVTVAPGDELPSMDATRYPSQVATDSFTVADLLPSLTLAASDSSPVWKHAVTLAGTLSNALGSPFTGATVVAETSTDGVRWTRLSTERTGLRGSYALTFVPTRRTGVRVRFSPPSTYLPACSVTATVAPEPTLSAPSVPKTASHGRRFTVRGTLTPGPPAGTGSIVIRVQHKVAGGWSDRSTVKASCSGSAGGSTYAGSLSLPKGSWRVRVQTQGDALYAAASSAWSVFTFR